MAYAGVQSTVNFCLLREAELTNQITDIMFDITRATREMGQLAEACADAKQAVRADKNYSADNAVYTAQIQDIQDDYELNLAQISSWEQELETQKAEKETEIQASSTYRESFTAVLKENIQKDYTYGGGK